MTHVIYTHAHEVGARLCIIIRTFNFPGPVMAKTQCQSRESSSSVVLVTGFGPFHHHTVNASWAAVQELQKIGVRDVDSVGVTLAIREVYK